MIRATVPEAPINKNSNFLLLKHQIGSAHWKFEIFSEPQALVPQD